MAAEKMEQRISAAVTDFQKLQVRRAAELMGTDEAGLVKQCIAIALPQLLHVSYLQRVRLDDNDFFKQEP